MIEEKQHICMLIDIYDELLTDKQREVLHDYYYNDYSLSEIAESLGITKQAVKDSIDKARKSLVRFENALHIATKKEEFNKLFLKKNEMELNLYVELLENIIKE
ncbi:MAG: hypothetical protein IJZ29_02815 [Clostridia bacterium]|nr:hypothetical protein [Clostridia bacterium]